MSDNRLETRQDSLSYREAGDGEPVVLLHCSAGSAGSWRAIIDSLGENHRVLAPDLLGYGRSAPWRRGAELEPASELVNVSALLDLAGRPVHLVGHSYGGTVAINAAKRFPERIASLTLIEPVAFHLLRAADRPDGWREVAAVAERHIALVGEGRDAEAAEAFVTYWMGASVWEHTSGTVRDGIVRAMAKVAAEWRLMFAGKDDLAAIAGINAPALLICGGRTRKPARQVIETLRSALPRAGYLEIAEAGHMSPLTHPAIIAEAVRAHIASETLELARSGAIS
jgi:pimeloyl-ACP methyl ester carboxylesterase